MRVIPATILLLENRVGCKKGIPTAMAILQEDCLFLLAAGQNDLWIVLLLRQGGSAPSDSGLPAGRVQVNYQGE